MTLLLGLRTVVYPALDLATSKAWFTGVLGVAPYFDEPFYVGFEVGGYELGLVPAADGPPAPVTYWGVADADASVQQLLAAGASTGDPVTEVGGGIRVATVIEPGGSTIGVIENPNFQLPAETGAPLSDGPGR
jgi:predicted enzyme related to lactoylglutathione lyase